MATNYTEYLAKNKIALAEQKNKAIQNQQLAEQQRIAQEQKEIQEKNVLERVGETALDVLGTLGKGLFGLGEGVVDAGAAIGGFVGGIFGADTDWAEDFISFNATEEWIGKNLDNATKSSYMNDTFVEDVVEGIGQMLPTIGLMVAAPFTGGATLAGVPYTVGATVASAGGKGVEEALDEDAEFNQAFGYGLINAGIEGLIEYATAGMGKGITSIGKSVGKDTAKSAAKSLGKVVLEEAASEAIEEGLTEFLNPLAKGVTYKDFGEEMKRYTDGQLYKDAAYAAAVGGLVGGITAGAGGVSGRIAAGGNTNFNIQESIKEVTTLDTKADNLFNKGKLTAENVKKIREQRQAELNNISTQLKSLNTEERVKTIEKYNLSKLFNENGDLKSNLQTNSQNKALISEKTNIEAYSPSIMAEDLKLAPTTKDISEASRSAKNVIAALDSNMRIVVTENTSYNGNKFNAFYDQNNRIIYLNNKASKIDIMKQVAVHELTHSLEGTKQYNKFVEHIKSMFTTEQWNALLAEKMQQYQNVNQSLKQGEIGDVVAVREAETELIAEFAGELFSNEDSIRRIVNQNKNLATRIYEWIKEAVAKLTKKGQTKGEEYAFLRKAEKLYADALKNSVGGYSLTEFRQNVSEKLTQSNKQNEVVEGKKVEARFSLDTDSQGNELNQKQIEFFKDSKVRDENGKLLTVYHNSPNLFTIFDKNQIGSSTDYGAFGRGFYFGNTKWSNYGTYEYEVYLNIKNPFIIKGTDAAYNFRKEVLELAGKKEFDDITAKDMDLMTKKLIKEGYDGVIYERDFDKTRNEYVAFESSQIKSVNNANPTLSEDIRYSLESDKNVKDLIVIHNINNSQLLDAINLGGLIVPSIAVTKANSGFTNFGETSLIFKSDTIDPLKDRRNKVFESDVYSKTFPKTVNKITNQNIERVYDIFKKNAEPYGFDKYSLYNLMQESSISDAVRNLISDLTVRVTYLQSKGVEIKPIYKTLQNTYGIDNDIYNKFLEKYKDKIENLYDLSFDEVMEFQAEVYQMTNEAFAKYIKNKYNKTATDIKEYGYADVLKFLEEAKKILKNKDTPIFDRYATSDKIKEAIKDENDLYKWIEETITPYYEEGQYFRNNKDPFTPSGNRRSFDQLYEKVTLSSILNYMTGKVQDSEGFDYGVGNLRSLLAKQFKTINEIKKNKNKIVTHEEMEVLKKQTEDSYWAIISEITKDSGYNRWSSSDVGAEVLKDLAKTNTIKENIERRMLESKLKQPSEELIKDIQDFFEVLKNYQTEYFEAKPQRIVDFNEVVAVIAPVGTDVRILDFFNKKGVMIKLYGENTNMRSEQIASLPEDIRFALQEKSNYKYSKGQVLKMLAERTKDKAYTKVDAEKTINTILNNTLSFGDKYGEIANKTKNQVVDMFWNALNTKDEGYRAKTVLDIADYIIENAVAESIYDTNAQAEAASYVINALRPYLRKLDLSGLKGEISHRYDKDNSVYARWGKRKGMQGYGVDAVAQELAEMGIQIKSTSDADIFFEIDGMYRQALSELKAKAKEKLAEVGTKEEIEQLRQSIAKELLIAWDTTGHKTEIKKIVEKYTGRITQLKQALKEVKLRNKAVNNVLSDIERMTNYTKYVPAEVGERFPQVVNFVKKIKEMKTWRNNLSKNAREVLKELPRLYEQIASADENNPMIGIYNAEINEIANGKGELTTQELIKLSNIFKNFIHTVRNYNQIFFESRSQKLSEVATQGIDEVVETQKVTKKFGKISSFWRQTLNPYDRMSEIAGYNENSIVMKLYKELFNGNIKRAEFNQKVDALYSDFMESNKNYFNELQKEIKVGEITLTKGQAITLFMTSLREQGRSHLFNETSDSGIIHVNDNKSALKGNLREAFVKGKDVKITASDINAIYEMLTDTDKEFIKLTKKFFNEVAQEAKVEVDERLLGATNIETDGNYIPIRVSNDTLFHEAGNDMANRNEFITQMAMNKSTKPGASNKIVIDDIFSIIAKHQKDMALYYGYAEPIVNYNRIMNAKNAEGLSMRNELAKIDPYFEKYMDELLRDIQKLRQNNDGWSRFLNWTRWAGANAALALNPKVLVTQTVSLASALSEFDAKYVVKGLSKFFSKQARQDIVKYAPLMAERMEVGNSVDVVELRQNNRKIGGTIGKIGTALTKPISWMDSNVISALWQSSLYETSDKLGKPITSEEVKVESGKRLQEVVFKTQQSSDSLARSAIMRNPNEFVKAIRMFHGDSFQLFSRMYSAVNKNRVAKRMIKSNDSSIVKKGEALLKQSKTELRKVGTAFTMNMLMLVAIAEAFKWFKGNEKDEPFTSESMWNEFVSSMLGMIPLGSELNNVMNGYDVSNMSYSALSNIYTAMKELMDGIDSLAKGEHVDATEVRKTWRKVMLGLSQTFGVPLRNLETYSKAIIGKISPATREEYEALFGLKSNKNYIAKISAALENGDEDMADRIINIMFNAKTGKIKDDKVMEVTRDLLSKGYNVLPKTLSSTIIYNNQQIELTKKQYAEFKKIYEQSNDIITKMINSSSFERLNEEAKAKAIKIVYDYYYNLGLENLIGESIDNKVILFATGIPIEQLSMAVAQAQTFEADVDRLGNVINGSKKIKVQRFINGLKISAAQKYMIMGYLGYSNKNGGGIVKAYINRLQLSKSEKETLYTMSGYSD